MGFVRSKRFRTVLTITILVVFAVLAFWLFFGTFAVLGRFVAASGAAKTFLVFALITIFASFISLKCGDKLYSITNIVYAPRGRDREILRSHEDRLYAIKHAATALAVISGIVAVTSAFAASVWGSFHQNSVLVASVEYTDNHQPDYKWRSPLSVALAKATESLDRTSGDSIENNPVFLPGTNKYTTTIKARGFTEGLRTVFTQNSKSYETSSCSFNAKTPVSRGLFNANLGRVLSSIDASVRYNPKDVWAYCDGEHAKLVVPITKMVGFPQSHPVPAGVVIFDGKEAEIRRNVKSGELPGPVYPSSLAAAQRSSLAAENGFKDFFLRRASFETIENLGGDSSADSVSEILLKRSNSNKWDYVTPLASQSQSLAIAAIAVVAADTVTAGKLNKLTVHRLPVAREGSVAAAERIKTVFPQVGWSAGVQVVEIIPASLDTWVASLSDGRSVLYKVTINKDGSLCLLEVSGKKIDCTASYNSVSSLGAGGGEYGEAESPVFLENLKKLTDKELAELALEVAQEQLRRNSGN